MLESHEGEMSACLLNGWMLVLADAIALIELVGAGTRNAEISPSP